MNVSILNTTDTPAWVGLYRAADRTCQSPIGGARKAVRARAGIGYDTGEIDDPRLQVVFWNNDGSADQPQLDVAKYCFTGPKTIWARRVVSLVQDDGHFFAVNRDMSTGSITPMEKIDHVVVLMMENRSFDNLAGWLYSGRKNEPPHNIPAPGESEKPSYDGLLPSSDNPTIDDRYWNTFVPSEHDSAEEDERVYVHQVNDGEIDGSLNVPNPGPVEVVPGFIESVFGTDTADTGAQPNMWGFLKNYYDKLAEHFKKKKRPELQALAKNIMATYTPEQVPVFSALARNFAISDRWFCSVNAQTWPNRSFIHAGTAFGRLNNLDGLHDEGEHVLPWQNRPNAAPFSGKTTIFDVLDEVGMRSAYYESDTFKRYTLYYMQFLTSKQYKTRKERSTRPNFANDLNAIDQYPHYAFIEPQMFYALGYVQKDYHPPAVVANGDATLREVYEAITEADAWHRTLLIITFDESGNCYDHVAPPAAIRPPQSGTPQFNATKIGTRNPADMYGARIPTILVSPYIEKGTVFRSDRSAVNGIVPEYDHCSVLASLRDWIYGEGVTLPSSLTKAFELLQQNNRVLAAPTVWQVLKRDEARTGDAMDMDKLLESATNLYRKELEGKQD